MKNNTYKKKTYKRGYTYVPKKVAHKAVRAENKKIIRAY